MNKVWIMLIRFLKNLFLSLGVFSILIIGISFTRIPFDIHRWLGTEGNTYFFKPDHIVFLGGSGMPSESNLIRIYYVVALAQKYPASKVLIVHPIDDAVIHLMCKEIIQKGIDSSRIEIEKRGANTREQAIVIAEDFSEMLTQNNLIVTSPENMRRTLKVFRKVGFKHIGGESAFENAMFVDLTYDHKELGGKKYSPNVSSNLTLRYNFWNQLKLQITCMRELAALGYYKLNGWI